MSAWRRIACPVVVVLALAVVPSSAVAQSGNITNIAPTGSGTLQATFSIDWSYCKPYGSGIYGCSWYAVAYWRPIGSDCLPDVGAQLWVGDFHEASGTETTTATFYPPNNGQAFNVCLYVHGQGTAPYLVSLNSYWPPPPPPPPAPPTPVTSAQPLPSSTPPPATTPAAGPTYHLSVNLARRAARRAMATRFDGATHRAMKCYSVADDTVNCDVTWWRHRSRYKGTVTVTNGLRGVRSTIDAKMVTLTAGDRPRDRA